MPVDLLARTQKRVRRQFQRMWFDAFGDHLDFNEDTQRIELVNTWKLYGVSSADSTAIAATSETTFSTGDIDLAADLLNAGRALRVTCAGVLSTDNPAGDLTLRVRVGGELVTTIAISGLGTSLNDVPFHFTLFIVCRADGSLAANLVAGVVGTTPLSAARALASVSASIVNALTVSAEWSAANQSVVLQLLNVEVT